MKELPKKYSFIAEDYPDFEKDYFDDIRQAKLDLIEQLIIYINLEKQMWVKGIERAELVSEFNDGLDTAILNLKNKKKSLEANTTGIER